MSIGLTKKQRDDIEEFLHLFADVESALKKRLGRSANDTTGISMLINGCVEKNPYWTEPANRLRNLADIRNLLTHQRGSAIGYPIAVTPFSLLALREIMEHLRKPEPVSDRYRKKVITVSDQDSLASVLAMVFENGFSQFPVFSGDRFSGLITENEITRWLGRQVKANSVDVNLEAVTVRMVLKGKRKRSVYAGNPNISF
jgi:CBS domain-containing protein